MRLSCIIYTFVSLCVILLYAFYKWQILVMILHMDIFLSSLSLIIISLSPSFSVLSDQATSTFFYTSLTFKISVGLNILLALVSI
jgi:NADH:ubiquinone oxidoreductase subunit K